MNDALPVILVVGGIAVSVILVRLANAFARRLEARASVAALPDPSVEELREELAAMQERLDFLERALVAQRNQDRSLPTKGQ
jgi:hypothetical protein